jgi:rhomboid family GlyGly-CTERM serine protease
MIGTEVMTPDRSTRWWTGAKWTLSLSGVLVLLNLDLALGTWTPAGELLTAMEFHGEAIRQGEVWRLLTGNLVHFNRAHFYLDVGVFMALGLLYERYFAWSYPWLLLVLALAAGLGGLVFWPEPTVCRGLSGVDSGLFAAALCVEFALAAQDRTRWLWVAPAAMIFAIKNAYELATGHSFFGTEALLGPAKLATEAHTAAIVAAVAFCLCALMAGHWPRIPSEDIPRSTNSTL